jgi:hypothetical protein
MQEILSPKRQFSLTGFGVAAALHCHNWRMLSLLDTMQRRP